MKTEIKTKKDLLYHSLNTAIDLWIEVFTKPGYTSEERKLSAINILNLREEIIRELKS